MRRSELPADTIKLARYLIGKTLVLDLPQGRLSGRIVETEAYPVGDAAGHAFTGETPSRRSLFLRHGHAYVYFTYGSSFMMNVSSEEPGVGAGVLFRALEPLEGIPFMERRRGTRRLLDLTRGPGVWPRRWALTSDLTASIYAREASCGSAAPSAARDPSARAYESELLATSTASSFLRTGNPFVSGPKRLNE